MFSDVQRTLQQMGYHARHLQSWCASDDAWIDVADDVVLWHSYQLVLRIAEVSRCSLPAPFLASLVLPLTSVRNATLMCNRLHEAGHAERVTRHAMTAFLLRELYVRDCLFIMHLYTNAKMSKTLGVESDATPVTTHREAVHLTATFLSDCERRTVLSHVFGLEINAARKASTFTDIACWALVDLNSLLPEGWEPLALESFTSSCSDRGPTERAKNVKEHVLRLYEACHRVHRIGASLSKTFSLSAKFQGCKNNLEYHVRGFAVFVSGNDAFFTFLKNNGILVRGALFSEKVQQVRFGGLAAGADVAATEVRDDVKFSPIFGWSIVVAMGRSPGPARVKAASCHHKVTHVRQVDERSVSPIQAHPGTKE